MMPVPLAFLQMPSFPELLLIAAIGLLLFGKRLPEVGRSLGKGIVEFKKGIRGIEDDVDISATGQGGYQQQRQIPPQGQQYQPLGAPTQYQQPMQTPPGAVPTAAPTAPAAAPYRFDPYTGKPIESAPGAPGENPPGV
jgi:sec-independent protein translocase protein TatA